MRAFMRPLMRTAIRPVTLTLGALGTLGLAACSNSSEGQISARSVIQSAITRQAPPDALSTAEISALVSTTLASTTSPVILIGLPKRKQVTTMVQIETNRGYETYGSSDRRTITLNGGILTATRGLGEDIMSVDVSRVAPLIRGAREGSAYRINRSLDGENVTLEERTYCQIKIGAPRDGLTEVLESCVADDLSYQNAYYIAPGGRIIESRQWHSPLSGYVTIQQLR